LRPWQGSYWCLLPRAISALGPHVHRCFSWWIVINVVWCRDRTVYLAFGTPSKVTQAHIMWASSLRQKDPLAAFSSIWLVVEFGMVFFSAMPCFSACSMKGMILGDQMRARDLNRLAIAAAFIPYGPKDWLL
jgi:hypothetical protein